MKSVARRCPKCEVLTNPFNLFIVEYAWIEVKSEEEQVAHFSYKCPHCLIDLEIKMGWDENLH